jgi:outer membrane protein OmpA-like peptidoglycan-associated protein
MTSEKAIEENIMKNSNSIRLPSFAMAIVPAFFAVACATATPVELQNARVAFGRASAGPAAQLAPSDLHKAQVALDDAERSFAVDKDASRTADLAYIAERTAQIAEARADAAGAEKSTAMAKQAYGAKQADISQKTAGALVKTREQLTEAERGQAQQAQLTATERTAREEADRKAAASEQKAAASEQKATDANAALAKLAAKEEERGLVITLSGSVLFRSNDSTLLPAAQTRLDQVASALVAKDKEVVVEGYTDSTGSQATNMRLSQSRAESVRSYLVSRGFPGEKISARGMGPDRPIAENTSSEGRANNRRVEIVIAKTAGKTY